MKTEESDLNCKENKMTQNDLQSGEDNSEITSIVEKISYPFQPKNGEEAQDKQFSHAATFQISFLTHIKFAFLPLATPITGNKQLSHAATFHSLNSCCFFFLFLFCYQVF